MTQTKTSKKEIDVEEYICDNGWNAYIEHCVDIIYFNFHNFGWKYGENEHPDRDALRNNIIELITHILKTKNKTGQVESGRIAVDIVDNSLFIALTL